MKFNHRRSREIEEGESYYISMTDMMVGVLFVFIIMLSFFALQFRTKTAALTKAKDSETTALLEIATALERKDVSLQIDRTNHIVCIPGSALVDGAADSDRHCFAYTNTGKTEQPASKAAAQSRSNLMAFIAADLDTAQVKGAVNADAGNLSFSAEQLFAGDTANLSTNGQTIAKQVAATMAARLPCYAYGAPTTNACDGAKMSVVNVTAQAGFDAFSEEGRKAAALALQRSVAFHQALTAAQPVLAQLRSAPGPGAQPLLRVASYGQSEMVTPPAGGGQTISIQFQMAQ